MKSVVIDANVFHAFFYETIHEKTAPERTASSVPIFSSLGAKCIAFVDDGTQVETEWRNLCKGAPEWFDAWLADCYIEGKIYPIEASKEVGLNKRYWLAGFPRGKDLWYIKIAYGLACLCKRNNPYLIAEDIDFYDPTKKAATNKAAIFRAGKGPVSSLLRSDGVKIRCISTFCDEI